MPRKSRRKRHNTPVPEQVGPGISDEQISGSSSASVQPNMENELSAEVDVLSLGSEGSEDEEPTVDFDPRIDYQNDKDPNALDLIGKRVQVPISYYG